jgi:quinol monooxygenase YgiN
VALVISILHIVAAPRYRAEVVRTLAVQLRATRAKPGCLRCDLFQDLENWDAIAMMEEWASRADLDLRLRSEDDRAVLAAIDLSCGRPGILFDTVTRRGGLERAAVASR